MKKVNETLWAAKAWFLFFLDETKWYFKRVFSLTSKTIPIDIEDHVLELLKAESQATRHSVNSVVVFLLHRQLKELPKYEEEAQKEAAPAKNTSSNDTRKRNKGASRRKKVSKKTKTR